MGWDVSHCRMFFLKWPTASGPHFIEGGSSLFSTRNQFTMLMHDMPRKIPLTNRKDSDNIGIDHFGEVPI